LVSDNSEDKVIKQKVSWKFYDYLKGRGRGSVREGEEDIDKISHDDDS